MVGLQEPNLMGAKENASDCRKPGPPITRADCRTGGGTNRVKSEVRNFAEQQKAAGADQIAGFAQAADATANKLQDVAPKGADYVHDLAGRLAGRLEEVASALRISGAVATGFALSDAVEGRRSSSEQDHYPSPTRRVGRKAAGENEL
jgi:hypothetical protein